MSGWYPAISGTSNLYIFNSGTHEFVIQIDLNADYKVNMEDLKEELGGKSFCSITLL